MSNINDSEDDLDLDLDIEDDEEEDDEDDEDKDKNKSPKPKESDDAKKSRLERQLKQLNKKMGVNVKQPEKPKKQEEAPKKGELDRIDRAVLRTEGITHPDEIALIEEIMADTGKDVESILESRFFKSELKNIRNERTLQDAMPKSTKRANATSPNSVEYWLAKGELPPASEGKLRQEVVNAKIAREKSKQKTFSDNAVIGS